MATTDQYLEAMDALQLALDALKHVRAKVSFTGPSEVVSHGLVAYVNVVRAADKLFKSASADGLDLDAARHERDERENLQREFIF